MKKKGVHNSYAIQASHTNLSNSLVSQYPPDPGEHVSAMVQFHPSKSQAKDD